VRSTVSVDSNFLPERSNIATTKVTPTSPTRLLE
jgi:hypothetical protein